MIYVVGSLNMDFAATLGRMPRAGETLAAQSVLVSPGGKGANQAAAIARLGGACAMIGKVGRDAFGKEMRDNLARLGVQTDCITEADAPSGTAMIWVQNGNNRIVLDPGANALLTPADVDAGLQSAKAGDVLVAQLEVPPETVLYALSLARRKGMLTVLNPAPATPLPEAFYEHSDLLVPNETETEILSGVYPDCEVTLALAAKKLRASGARQLLVTLGKRGSALIVGNEITLLPAVKVRAVDTTAAGDTFVGALALKLHAGENLLDAAQFATFAAALKVTRKGATVAIPSADEVDAFIRERNK